MDMPRGAFFGNYNNGAPNFPQNDPGYPQQQYNNNSNYQEPRPPPPPFNGPEPNFNYNQRQQQPVNNAPNGSFQGGGGSWQGRNHGGAGHSGSLQNRKRGWNSNRQGPPDHGDGLVKLYVAYVPRTANESDIRLVFEQHGRVAEVVLLKDKRTGQQQGSCFVKYGTKEEAEKAIGALNDKFTFPGEMLALKVKYAEGHRERPGGQREAPPSIVKGDNHGSQWTAPAPAPAPAPAANSDNHGSQWAAPPPASVPANNGDNHGGQWPAPPPAVKVDNPGGQWPAPAPSINSDNNGGQWPAPVPSINSDNNGSQWSAPPPGFQGSSRGGNWAGPPPVVNGDNHGSHRVAPPSTVQGDSYGACDKLYVGGINKHALKKEIEDIFSPYGIMEDVFIARDEMKQIRCAFIKYSHRDMALAAIKSLNGTFTMRGCELPLIVRFAAPKRPKTGETRTGANHGDSMGGFRPNSAHTMHHKSGNSQQPINQAVTDPWSVSRLFPPPPLQQIYQGTPKGSQISTPLAAEGWKQSDDIAHKSNLNLMQQPSSKSPRSGLDPQTAASTCTVPMSNENEVLLECDWSQHICPDGDKYYYNSVTFESTWEKPDEFAKFEQELEKQQIAGQYLKCRSAPSVKQVGQPQQTQLKSSFFHQEKSQAEIGPAIVPACG